MKKVIAALLLCTMVLSMFTLPAFALTDEEIGNLAGLPNEDESGVPENLFDPLYKECISDPNHVIYMPVLHYHETDEGNFITATYVPDLMTQLLVQPEIRQKYNLPDNWKTHIRVDFKWDDDEWFGSKESIDSFSGTFANTAFQYDTPITKPVTMILFDLRTYHPLLDTEDVFKDIIYEKDGKWAIDFSKHTLSIRFDAGFEANNHTIFFTSDPSTLQVIPADKLPDEIAPPTVGAAHYNHSLNTVYWQLLASDEMRARTENGEKFHTIVRYQYKYENDRVNGWSEPMVMQVREHEMLSAHLNPYTSKDEPLIFMFQVAYVNSETGQQSEWTELALGITYDNPPTYDVLPQIPVGPNAPAEDNRPIPGTNVGEYVKYYKCSVCQSCPTQPFGMCLWLFVGACVALTSTILCTTLIIVDVVKKRKLNKS